MRLKRGRRRVIEFTLAVFTVYLIGGSRSRSVRAGWSSLRSLARVRANLQAHWPTCLAGLALTAGLLVASVGLAGLDEAVATTT